MRPRPIVCKMKKEPAGSRTNAPVPTPYAARTHLTSRCESAWFCS